VGAKNRWWSLTVVRETLRNRIYCGDMIQGKTRSEGGMQVAQPESTWTVTVDTHEAIVSRELFAEVQKKLEKPKPTKSAGYKTEKTEDVIGTKVFCGDCGSRMYRNRTSERTYDYTCQTRGQFTPMACRGMRTTERFLKTVLLERLLDNEFLITAPPADAAKKPDSEIYKDELAKVKAETERNGGYLKGLYESLKLEDITETEYRELKSTYEARMASLSEKESLLREKILASSQREKALEQARSSTLSVKAVNDLTTEVIAQTVEAITVHAKDNIEVALFDFGAKTSSDKEGADHD
jgi:hypothetical protein